MKVASLFSGIGGFEKGILQASEKIGVKTKIVFASEIDKHPRKVYKSHFGGKYLHGDIKEINETNVPHHEILCGGFPCQDVSIAGKRAGLCGARSGLFYDIIRILREKQPKLVFLENVAGLLSSNKGWDFARVIIELEGVGYTCEWQILNSRDYGVAQNRKRVYIIGHLRGSGTRQIFPITKKYGAISKTSNGECICAETLSTRNQSGQAQWDGSTTLIACDSGQGRKIQIRSDVVAPLRANTGAGHNNIVCHSTLPRSSKTGKGGSGHLSKTDGTTYCIDAANNVAIEIPQMAGCLTGGGHSGGNHSDMTVLNNGNGIRRLTPIECERLQGFPDNWTEGISDTQRYKCLGNAVTVNVIQFIAERLLKAE